MGCFLRICQKGQNMKKRVSFVLVVALVMLAACIQKEKQEDGYSSTVITSGGEVISAYCNGEDVTDDRKALEEQTKGRLASF